MKIFGSGRSTAANAPQKVPEPKETAKGVKKVTKRIDKPKRRNTSVTGKSDSSEEDDITLNKEDVGVQKKVEEAKKTVKKVAEEKKGEKVFAEEITLGKRRVDAPMIDVSTQDSGMIAHKVFTPRPVPTDTLMSEKGEN